MKNHLPHSSKGFTLTELIVTVTIISLLAVIGISTYSNAQKTARDGKRKGDIDAISKTLEIKYSGETYPAVTAALFPAGVIPDDLTYPYTYYNSGVPGAQATKTTSGSSYIVCAQLEGGSGNSFDTQGTPPGAGQPATHYCRKNQQ